MNVEIKFTKDCNKKRSIIPRKNVTACTVSTNFLLNLTAKEKTIDCLYLAAGIA